MFSESLLRKRQLESQIKAQDTRDQGFISRAVKRPVLIPDDMEDALKASASRGNSEAVRKELNPEQSESVGKKEGSSELKKNVFDKESSQTEAKKEEL